MQKIVTKIETELKAILMQETTITDWVVLFSVIVALRVFIEFFLASRAIFIELILIEYLHNFLFFALAIGLIWLNLSFFLKVNLQKLSRLFLWSLWGILLPPIFDMLKTRGGVFWSFYIIGGPKFLFSQYLLFLSGLPSGIVYFGTKIVFLASIILSASVIFIKTKNIFRSISGAFFTYTALFLIGSAPSILAIIYYLFRENYAFAYNLEAYQIIQLFSSSLPIFGVNLGNLAYALPYNLEFILYFLFLVMLGLFFLLIDRKKTLAIFRNARFPQLIYHGGLFFMGMGLGAWFYRENVSLNVISFFATIDLLLAIWFSWLASVVVNDIYDFSLDSISNPERPLQSGIIDAKKYSEIGWLFFYLALFGGCLVSLKFAGLFLVYQMLAWVYSANPYRLKRFPIIASFMSAMASMIIFFIGFSLFSGDQNITELSWRVTILLIISYTFSLPIKDLKDIAGDKKDGVMTLPVIFGEKTGRIIIGSGMFFSFLASVFLLNEKRLFFPALFFAALTYLVVNNKKIHPRKVFWWILPLISTYGLFLVKIIFFS